MMTRGEQVVAFIETHCKVTEGALAETPMKLLDFQKRFILDIYDNAHGTHRAILSVSKKNGKTALIASLVLAHLVGPEASVNCQIVSGALTREQAGLVFKHAAAMVRMDDELRANVRIVTHKKELHGLLWGSSYKALASKGSTTQGISPVLAIVDEIGGVIGPEDPFVSAIASSQGAHESPLFIAISTQAASDADLLSLWIDDARKSGDPRVICHVYEAPADCKIDDPEAWKAANPALGIFRSLADIEAQAELAKRMPSAENSFRNLQLNQRIPTGAPFVTKNVWALNSGQPDSLVGLDVYGGLDLSTRNDLTALVLAGRDAAGVWHLVPYFWTPLDGLSERARRDRVPYELWRDQGFLRATPGSTVDYEYVARDLAEICDGLNVRGIAFDPHHIAFLQKEFDRISLHLPLVMCHQGFNGVNPGLCALEAELLNGRVRHGMHPVLTMCASGAVTESNSENQRRFSKKKTNARIDGIVSSALAFGAYMKDVEPEKPAPKYDIFFVN